MSTDNITPFLQKSRTDAALREQVNAIYEQADVAVAQALAQIAAEVGLPFTAEEFLTEEHSVLPDEELSDVSGGIQAISPRISLRQREKEGNAD